MRSTKVQRGVRVRNQGERSSPEVRQGRGKPDPRDLGARCKECPFAKNGAPSRPVLGEGPKNPVALLVGEGPGREEAETGRPFVGITGQQLDEELLAAGLPRTKLFIVNATCCQPTGRSLSDFRKAVVACNPALIAQLKRLPKNIPTLAMGRWAMFALTGKDRGIALARGFIRDEWTIPQQPLGEEDGSGDDVDTGDANQGWVPPNGAQPGADEEGVEWSRGGDEGGDD
jgi:uracil-DNA glycosylase family 4